VKPAGKDDGSEVIALARAVGLTGIRPAPAEQPPSSLDQMACGVDDGSDVIALARAVGLSGIRPAPSRRTRSVRTGLSPREDNAVMPITPLQP
jgi:hypothetical protein